jgi:hypothetical protein
VAVLEKLFHSSDGKVFSLFEVVVMVVEGITGGWDYLMAEDCRMRISHRQLDICISTLSF